jgi:hypothetical protein
MLETGEAGVGMIARECRMELTIFSSWLVIFSRCVSAIEVEAMVGL